MMAWALDNNQQAMVRDHFIALDTNHDGGVDLSELRAVMVDRFGVPEAEVASIFTLLIEAHDREIHYSDFLAAMACEHIELDDDLLQSTFSKFDTQGVGYIAAHDFHKVLGVSLEDGHAEALVHEADRQGEGRIDYKDFVSYTRSNQQRVRKAAAAATGGSDEEGVSWSGGQQANPTLLEAQRRLAHPLEAKEEKMPVSHEQDFERSQTADIFKEDACCTLM